MGMGILATLGKITAALGESAGLISDNIFQTKGLRQIVPLANSAESRSKPSLRRASGPPPAPIRM